MLTYQHISYFTTKNYFNRFTNLYPVIMASRVYTSPSKSVEFEEPLGLLYVPNFISQEEHDSILSSIDENPWESPFQRRVQQYGYHYDYKSRNLGKYLGQIPDFFKPIADKLVENKYFPTYPEQALVNEYLPGQGISKHIDIVENFGPVVCSVTLGSTSVMRFEQKGKRNVDVFLEPCSLVLLTGESRYRWYHSIPGRKFDKIGKMQIKRSRRVAVTLRNVIQEY